MRDEPRKTPTHLHQADGQRYLEGYDVGRIALNVTRAEGFKPLAAATAQVVDSLAAH